MRKYSTRYLFEPPYHICGFSSVINITVCARQFGNILMLVATYNSPASNLVPAPQLRYLLDRTIKFLGSLCPISGTLAKDVEILTRLRPTIPKPLNL